MNAWGQVREAAQRVVSRVAEAYRGQREERYGGEVIVAPEELLGNGTPDAVIERHLQRLTRDANFTMIGERWARPGAPRFTFEVDDRDAAYRSSRPSYGPGTLRLRLDMQTHAADLRLPEANAKLTEALIGALAVAATCLKPDDLAGRRLVHASHRLLHEHGTPEVITLMGAMVEAAGLTRTH